MWRERWACPSAHPTRRWLTRPGGKSKKIVSAGEDLFSHHNFRNGYEQHQVKEHRQWGNPLAEAVHDHFQTACVNQDKRKKRPRNNTPVNKERMEARWTDTIVKVKK